MTGARDGIGTAENDEPPMEEEAAGTEPERETAGAGCAG